VTIGIQNLTPNNYQYIDTASWRTNAGALTVPTGPSTRPNGTDYGKLGDDVDTTYFYNVATGGRSIGVTMSSPSLASDEYIRRVRFAIRDNAGTTQKVGAAIGAYSASGATWIDSYTTYSGSSNAGSSPRWRYGNWLETIPNLGIAWTAYKDYIYVNFVDYRLTATAPRFYEVRAQVEIAKKPSITIISPSVGEVITTTDHPQIGWTWNPNNTVDTTVTSCNSSGTTRTLGFSYGDSAGKFAIGDPITVSCGLVGVVTAKASSGTTRTLTLNTGHGFRTTGSPLGKLNVSIGDSNYDGSEFTITAATSTSVSYTASTTLTQSPAASVSPTGTATVTDYLEINPVTITSVAETSVTYTASNGLSTSLSQTPPAGAKLTLTQTAPQDTCTYRIVGNTSGRTYYIYPDAEVRLTSFIQVEPLPNDTYTLYATAGKKIDRLSDPNSITPALTVYSDEATQSFEISVTPPTAPTLTTAYNATTNGVDITLQGRVNMVPADTSNLENSIGDWVASTNASSLATSTTSYADTYSLTWVATGAGTSSVKTGQIDVLPDRVYYASSYIRVATTNQTRLDLAWYTSTGSLISTTSGTAGASTANTFMARTVSGTAPPTAAYARVIPVHVSALTSAVAFVDSVGMWAGASGYTDMGTTNQGLTLERSEDGGTTWLTVYTTEAYPNGLLTTPQYFAFTDFYVPRAQSVSYRAIQTVTTAAGYVRSATTTTTATTTNDQLWWFKPLGNSARNTTSSATLGVRGGFTNKIEEQMGTFWAIGRDRPIVVSSAVGGEDGNLTFVITSTASWDLLVPILEHAGSIYLQDPLGGEKYIRITSRSWQNGGTLARPVREATVDYIEVSAP
jgi:hypothetical protein